MEWSELAYRVIQSLVRMLIVMAVPLIIAVQPIPFSLRILFILIWLYVAITISQRNWLAGRFEKEFTELKTYARCCFIALEIRNENEKLLPTYSRLRDDNEDKKAIEELRRDMTGHVALPAFLLILQIAFYVVLAGLVGYALVKPIIITDVLSSVEVVLRRWMPQTSGG